MMLLRFSFINSLGRRCNSLLNLQKKCYSYEGDGKTTVSFLNKESEGLLTINGYNRLGFRLNSGLFVVGPVIMFPKTLLSWNVADDDDINDDSLALFHHIEPKLDVVVIGLSDKKNSFQNQSYYVNKIMSLRKSKLNFELLPTEKAIPTFNFLCMENRFVAAALIPPKDVNLSDQDYYNFRFENWSGKDDYMFGSDMKGTVGEEKQKIVEKIEGQSRRSNLLTRKNDDS